MWTRTKIKSNNIWKERVLNKKKDGSDWILECVIAPVTNSKGEMLRLVSICHEVSKQEDLQNQNSISAPNHKAAVELEIDRNIELKNQFTLVVCKIDKFYENKEKEGVVVKITEIFKDTLRDGDFIGMWSEDSFAFICSQTNIGQTALIAERIRDYIERDKSRELRDITCSFGVAHFDGDNNKKELISNVLERLSSSEKSGGNRVCM